ncbi:HDOD domain-containing protein [Desulfonatronovibrio hydrogenovorans]|uniref:HDOD domain-containing protein n=1 Tax=Desulfonatronovibrio hydrogenovorans TaxID=53245 RepID=UPI00048ADBE1|nr:HDOD domain-containing protein [Desulfonatronovibrio hydrogenovorans]
MKKVCTEHLQPGMEIGKDVPGVDDSVFIPKGTLLSVGHIQGLIDLGISWVRVISQGEQEDLEDLARRCQEHVRPYFNYVDPDSPVFNSLYREVLESTMSRLVQAGDWVLPCGHEFRATEHQGMRDLFFKEEGGPEDIVSHEMELISVPDTYFRLQEILKSPDSSARHVADVVRLDVNLTAKLLRLVNSPIYAFPSQVDSIERAVAIIGVEGVSSLALGIIAMPMFKDIPSDLMDVSTFWRHSISCAIFSKELARLCGFEGEQFFTAGLLHDVGRLLLLKNLPQAYLQVLLHARGNTLPLPEAEEVILGFNHAGLGEKLLRAWGCPDRLASLVGNHHQAKGSDLPRQAAIIQLADNMAVAFAIAGGWSYVLPGMEDDFWQELKLGTNQVVDLFQKHGEALRQVSHMLI